MQRKTIESCQVPLFCGNRFNASQIRLATQVSATVHQLSADSADFSNLPTFLSIAGMLDELTGGEYELDASLSTA